MGLELIGCNKEVAALSYYSTGLIIVISLHMSRLNEDRSCIEHEVLPFKNVHAIYRRTGFDYVVLGYSQIAILVSKYIQGYILCDSFDWELQKNS